MKAEQKLKDMNKKTKSSLNMRITSEVSKLAKKSVSAANAKERAAARKNAAGRAAIARAIASSKRAAKRQLNDAVGAMNRSLLALKTETAKKIKKTNHKVTAYAGALAKEAKDVD